MSSAIARASIEHLAELADSPSNRLETDKVGCVAERRQERHVQNDICLEWTIDEGNGRVPGEEAVEENESCPEYRGDALSRRREDGGAKERLERGSRAIPEAHAATHKDVDEDVRLRKACSSGRQWEGVSTAPDYARPKGEALC